MLRKLKVSDKADALRKVALFEGCTPAELEEIVGLTTDLPVAEGKVLCREGDLGHEFFVLIEGTAEITNEAGARFTVGPGDFFGELALLDDGPRMATVTMTSSGHVLVLSGVEFRALLRVSPGIALRMLAVLGRRVRAIDGH